MRGIDRAINLWLDPNFELPGTVFVDAQYHEKLLDWLRADPVRLQVLEQRKIQMVLYTRQLHEIFHPDADRSCELRNVGFKLRALDLRQQDKPLYHEALRAYFHNDTRAHAQALLYTLARREVESNRVLSILSQHRGFRRIPMVDTYYFPDDSLDGPDDLPAGFDFLQDFDIHRELVRVVQHRLEAMSYQDTMLTAIVALRNHIRQVSGLREDGRSLMERAFAQDGAYIRLNPLTNPDPQGSQVNEQRGFRELYCGMWMGLRNPLIHEGSESEFAYTRYSNKITLLKHLCFLSILFERADGPMP